MSLTLSAMPQRINMHPISPIRASKAHSRNRAASSWSSPVSSSLFFCSTNIANNDARSSSPIILPYGDVPHRCRSALCSTHVADVSTHRSTIGECAWFPPSINIRSSNTQRNGTLSSASSGKAERNQLIACMECINSLHLPSLLVRIAVHPKDSQDLMQSRSI